jgi:integrase
VIERSTRLGEKTKADYARCIRRFLQFAGEDPAGWHGAAVEAWRDSLSASLSPATVNKHIYALRKASQRLEGLGVGTDFARAAESMPTRQERKRTAMDQETVRALFATCRHGRPDDLRDRMVMTLAQRTASRVSNLVGLRWERLDGRVAHMVIKGNKAHKAVLDDRCLGAIDQWRAWLAGAGVGTSRGPVLRQVREGLDGSWRVGAPITRRQWVNEMLKRRAKEAGITGSVHPHLFRHTFVTRALEAGVPAHRVMGQTGHANLSTLSQYVSDLEAESDPVGDYLPEY